ncbi:MAG: STAS domain-containing protein [Phycisphaerae bacterium]|nr:STAS domain-containing protein [Phycisphaerae bacterium]
MPDHQEDARQQGCKGCTSEIWRLDGDTIVSLTGTLDSHHVAEVHEVLVGLCEQKPSRLIVNLSAVDYMDSSGIGTLVEVLRRTKAYNGTLVLCGLNEGVRDVFEMTRLDKVFRICSTEDEARHLPV